MTSRTPGEPDPLDPTRGPDADPPTSVEASPAPDPVVTPRSGDVDEPVQTSYATGTAGAPTPPRPAGTGTRPLGITILAILAAIGGFFSLLAGLAAVGLGGFAGAATGSAALGGIVSLIGVLVLVLGVVYLLFAYGAWTLQPWAWQLGVIASVVGIVLALLNILGGGADAVSGLINVLINGAILYYLNTPEVRAAFGRPATGWF